MRKNSARKWLHFTLDLLPVIAIPVFMIYSHRHSLTERTNVEINYKYETNDVNNLDDLVEGNVYYFHHLELSNAIDNTQLFTLNILKYTSVSGLGGGATDEFIYDTYDSSVGNCLKVLFTCEASDYYNSYFLFTNQYTYIAYEVDDEPVYFDDVIMFVSDGLGDFVEYYDGLMTDYDYDLPTSTDYNVIENVNADTTNENILNVFYKDFTDTIDNYFNFDNVFTFGDIWQWFNTNMFGGNASPIAHAVYEIIVYEFIIDIMFLSYCVFMFIIDFTTDTLERFTGWSSRG